MNVNETAESLGDKLAALDVTEAEGQLLLALIGGNEAETQGFGWDEGVAAVVGGRAVLGWSFGVEVMGVAGSPDRGRP